MNRPDHNTYQSPFTWRYSSDAMRYVWSEVYKRRLMRRVWVALAEGQPEEPWTLPTARSGFARKRNRWVSLPYLAVRKHHMLHARLRQVATMFETSPYDLSSGAGSLGIVGVGYAYRKVALEPIKFGYEVPLNFDANYYKGLLLVPLFWFGLYTVVGGYSDVFRRFRTKELGQTLLVSLVGVLVIFFVLLVTVSANASPVEPSQSVLTAVCNG